MYQASFKAVNPDELEMRLRIEMTMGEWKNLQEQLTRGKYPSVALSRSITDMMDKAEAQFISTGGDDENSPDERQLG